MNAPSPSTDSATKALEDLLVFLLPLIATNILQNLSGTINTVFVGQMMGVNAIAAVAVFFPFYFV
jgi:Na+-driven multidrug efflux pump